MSEFLHEQYFGNTVLRYLIAIGIIVIGSVLLRWIKRLVFKAFNRYQSVKPGHRNLRVVMDVLERSILPLVYLLIIYGAISSLHLSDQVANICGKIMMVLFTFFFIRIVIALIKAAVLAYLNKKEEDQNKISEISGLLIVVNLILWSVGIMFLLGNMGYNITTIIAGLGIGGIAIALAAQTVLGDFFSYFVIFFDKPFEVGDFVQVDDFWGTIVHIGIKTTRIENLVGEELVFSNTDLTGARLHNYNRMTQRRIAFDFGISKSTSIAALKELPGLIEKFIVAHPKAKFNRGQFTAIEDSSFRIAFVYYVLDPDYTVYLNVQQDINLAILEILEEKNISLAYPARTLYVEGDALNAMSGQKITARDRDMDVK